MVHISFIVVTKRTKCEAGTSVFHFVGTLGESDSDGVILVSPELQLNTVTDGK